MISNRLTALIFAGFLAACSGQSSPPPVATVGGQPISQALFEQYAEEKAGLPLSQLNPVLKESLLNDLKELKAASLAGVKTAGPDLEQELELKRIELLTRHAATAAGVYRTPTEAEFQQAYQEFAASRPAIEYHISHILVATESATALLITRLQGGADFESLARTESTDDSNTRGGDLGWIAPGKLPAAFTDAVMALNPGDYTRQPVHTPYGWHVIRLLETRPAEAPPFEQVKAQLASNIQQERYQQFLDESLRSAVR